LIYEGAVNRPDAAGVSEAAGAGAVRRARDGRPPTAWEPSPRRRGRRLSGEE